MIRRVLILLALAGQAMAQQPSQEALEAARLFVELAGGRQQAEVAIDAGRRAMISFIRATNPRVRDGVVTRAVDDFVMPELRARSPEILEDAAQRFAQTMTFEDLQQLIAFFESPLGRRLVEAQFLQNEQRARFSAEWTNRVIGEVLTKHRAALRARGLDF